MLASRQEKSRDATNKSDSHQGGERLLFNIGGRGRGRSSHLISGLTVDLFRGLGCLARQILHLGPGIAGNSTGSSRYSASHARG